MLDGEHATENGMMCLGDVDDVEDEINTLLWFEFSFIQTWEI